MAKPARPYANALNVASDARLVEGWALTEMARRMSLVETDGRAVREVVNLNQRLWTIFQAGLMESNCQVPKKIRLNLLALSAFIDRHSARIMADPRRDQLEVLIRINRGIASGLLTFPASVQSPPGKKN